MADFRCFVRLSLHNPEWLDPHVLMVLWLSFVLATIALVAVSVHLAGKDRGEPSNDHAALRWN